MIRTRHPDDRSEKRSTAEMSSAPTTTAANSGAWNDDASTEQHRVRQRHAPFRSPSRSTSSSPMTRPVARRIERGRRARRVGEVRHASRRRGPRRTTMAIRRRRLIASPSSSRRARSPRPAEPKPTSGASSKCDSSSWPLPCTSWRFSIARISASAHAGWNCVPDLSRSSSNATSCGSALRYERVEVIASYASATMMMYGSIG